MEALGSQLKKIRESRNISIEQVQSATKLQLKIIKAIEENQFDTINLTYLKGFLKIYCKYLGLNPDEFISRIQKSEAEEPKPAASENREFPTFKQEVQKKKTPINLNLRWVLLMFVIPLIVAFGFLLFRPKAIKPAKQPKSKAAIISQKKERPVKQKQIKEKKPQNEPPSTKQEPQPANVSSVSKDSLSLTIYAKQNCWLRVKIDGKTAFQNVLKKGITETWVAKEKLELFVGNAGGIELQLNGRVLPSLGNRGQVIKKILVTKDGIDISK